MKNCFLNRLKSIFKFIFTGKIQSDCNEFLKVEMNKISQKTEVIKSINLYNQMQLHETKK